MNGSFDIFNDTWYHLASNLIDNEITQKEYILFKNKKIDKLYASLDHLIIENIHLYNRILRYIIYIKTGKIVDEGKLIMQDENIDSVNEKMTPTRLYHLITLESNSTPYEIALAFPDIAVDQIVSFSDVFNQLIHDKKWFKNLVKYMCGKIKTTSYLHAITKDLTSIEDVNQYSNIKPDVSVFAYQETDIIEAFNKVHSLIDWNKTIYTKFETLIDDNTYVCVSDLNCRVFGTKFDYRFQVQDKETFLLNRTPYRGSDYELADNIVGENIPMLKRWHNKIMFDKTYFFKDVMKSLANYFLLEHKAEFIAIKRCGDPRLLSLVHVKKIGKSYTLYEDLQDTTSNKTLYTDKLITSSNIEELVKCLIDNSYYLFAHREQQSMLLEMCDSLFFSGNKQLITDYYINTITIQKETSNIKNKILADYNKKIRDIDALIFQELFNSTEQIVKSIKKPQKEAEIPAKDTAVIETYNPEKKVAKISPKSKKNKKEIKSTDTPKKRGRPFKNPESDIPINKIKRSKKKELNPELINSSENQKIPPKRGRPPKKKELNN